MRYDASALVSCYLARDFLQHKINNILESTANIQIVIIECNGGKELDGVSLPKSAKTIILNDRIPVWKAINIGIKESDSDLVVQANTDDLVSPNAYAEQITKINDGFDIAYFDYFITSGYLKDWETASKNYYTFYSTPTSGYSVGNGLGMFPMWRKSLHQEVGYFDENLEVYGDSLFWEQLVKHNKKFGRISKLLGAYAQRPGGNLESRLGCRDQEYLRNLKK